MGRLNTRISEKDRYLTVNNTVYELVVNYDNPNVNTGYSCTGCYFEDSLSNCLLDYIPVSGRNCDSVYNGIYVKSITMNRLKKLNDIFDKQLKFPWYE